MSTFLQVLTGIGIAVAAVPPSVLASILLIKMKLPLVLPGSIAGPWIVALIGNAVAGIPAALASGFLFWLIGKLMHPVFAAILLKYGGRSPYLPVIEGSDNTDLSVTLYNRGTILDSLGRHEEALRDFNRALEMRPNHSLTFNNRGLALHSLGRYEEALQDFNRALELKPDCLGAFNNRGITLRHLGRYEEALRDFSHALEMKPDHPETLSNRGVALTGLGRLEEALRDFNRALELRPDYPDALYNRGIALGNPGCYQEALRDCNRSLELRPDHPDTLTRALELFEQRGERKKIKAIEGNIQRLLKELQKTPPLTGS